MKSIGAVAFVSAVLVVAGMDSTPAEELSFDIVPYPQAINAIQGAGFVCTRDTVIRYHAETSRQPAEMLAAALRPATGFTLPVAKGGSIPAGILLTTENADAALGSEGYALRVTSDGIVVRAPNAAGLFYGGQTLRQLLPPEVFRKHQVGGTKWLIPAVEIRDQPRFPWRSFMLDVARNFKTKETVKMLLEQMAIHKMNRFHWHLTDDQGWRIEIKKYPKLTETGARRRDTQIGGWKTPKYTGEPHEGFYTQEDIREIVQFAADRHIMIIPEIGMPGHALAAIAAYPEFRCPEQGIPEVAYTYGKKPYVFNVADEKLYPFISTIIDEVVALFPGNVIHIGGDEVDHRHWKACAKISAMMAREKITTYSDVQVYFTNRLVEMIQKKNRRVMGWNEITGDLVHGSTEQRAERKLSKTAVVQFWKGSSDLLRSAITSGYDCVNSTHSSTYLDYTYGKISVKKAYDFNPIPRGLEVQHHAKVIGSGCQMWGEFIHDDARMEYRMFPRFCAYSEVGWTSPEQKDFEDFKRRLEESHLKRLDYQGIRYAKNVFMHEEHSAEEFADWVKIGEWTKPMMDKEYIFEWDASAVVKSAGRYEVALIFREGKHSLAPLWMELLEDGTPVSRDDHPGYAGNALRNNVYRFELKDFNAGSRYIIRMENCKSGGWKTLGDVRMRLIP
ncbi:MAG: beta-N-acetylhexosaminidase [Kiritimatiellia bacterium]|jgi:hexosaminidase|nr:beta-N-acetylhexosaminidase [Kiritimatiellia bacterium]